jgi:hypothetical protein
VDAVIVVSDLGLVRNRAARAAPDQPDSDPELDPERDQAPLRAGDEPEEDHRQRREPDDHHEPEHLGLRTKRIVHRDLLASRGTVVQSIALSTIGPAGRNPRPPRQ